MSLLEDDLSSLSVVVERIPQNKLRGHIEIARLDHWVKNISVLPGIAAALAFGRISCTAGLIRASCWALLATGLIASSNYVLNELMDAPFDRYPPDKMRAAGAFWTYQCPRSLCGMDPSRGHRAYHRARAVRPPNAGTGRTLGNGLRL